VTLQNRVTPFSELVDDPSYRGRLMGNRGVLHDDHQRIVRRHNGKRWIVCVLGYKGIRRAPMSPGRYTELFFFDDAVALAAGHRPCALCRPKDYDAYRRAIVAAGGILMSADELDARLDDERRVGNEQRRHLVRGSEVPDGAMVAIGEEPYLVAGGELHVWSSSGYRAAGSVPSGELDMLTPALTAMALRGGFRPALHPSLRASGYS
jgi:hypothetical protein